MKKIEIKKILVPIDFNGTSETAMITSARLAKMFDAQLFFIHVIESSGNVHSSVPGIASDLPAFPDKGNVEENEMDLYKLKISNEFGIIPEMLITKGDIQTEINAYSVRTNIDLIVMGTQGASGYNELLQGSKAQHVVTLSEIPVLTLQKGSDNSAFKNILIPIDNSLHSREKINLAMLIADVFGSAVHIIGIPDTNDEAELHSFKIKCESIEKIVASHHLVYKTTMIMTKNIAEAALQYATENNCDLIVINIGHESEFKSHFMGAFSQLIVNHSKIPILSFKHTHENATIETPGYGIS